MARPIYNGHDEVNIWHLLGAGNMGLLAAHYLQRSGAQPRFLALDATAPVVRTLVFDSGAHRAEMRVDTVGPAELTRPVERLLIATKAWQTRAAVMPLVGCLAPSVEIVCLQNGMGSLDDVALPAGARIVQAITTSGGWRHGDIHHVVAENSTLMGDGGHRPPHWFSSLRHAWPGLQWRADIQLQQLLKLAVNAVINPLTALHDRANGALIRRVELRRQMEDIAGEVDAILGRLRDDWPGATMARSLAIARATDGNTSSMCSDLRDGRTTEIEFINGWLVRQAEHLGVAAPLNQKLVDAVRARSRHS